MSSECPNCHHRIPVFAVVLSCGTKANQKVNAVREIDDLVLRVGDLELNASLLLRRSRDA